MMPLGQRDEEERVAEPPEAVWDEEDSGSDMEAGWPPTPRWEEELLEEGAW